jgi:uncharacterized membrane protein YcfT
MTELLAALGLIAGVVGAHEIGFWLGSLTRSADDPFDRQVALVRTSTAALVAFLIGFAFSGAASRFIDRADLIVKEANGAVLAIALWMTIDLDYPGTGVIRVSNLPVVETLAAMN